MGWNRREVVGAVATGAFAGCAGASVPRIPNPLGGDGGASAGSSDPGRTPNGTTSPPAGPSAADGGTATRRVFDELVWFATEYGPATDDFRSLADRTRNLAAAVSRRSSVGEDAVSNLERLTDRVETTAYDRLGPHFDTSPTVREFNREQFDRLRTFRAREDWDGAAGVLATVAERYATLATESYVATTFPRDPVRGPLVRYATADGHAEDAAFVAVHAATGESVRFQQAVGTSSGPRTGAPGDTTRYRTVFGPLSAEAGSESGAYVTVKNLIDGRTLGLSLQRYADAATARRAVEGFLAGDVTEERTATFGGREWRRVSYRPGSAPVYADLTRAGAFVVTVGPSERPWEDRPTSWQSPLKLTWMWE